MPVSQRVWRKIWPDEIWADALHGRFDRGLRLAETPARGDRPPLKSVVNFLEPGGDPITLRRGNRPAVANADHPDCPPSPGCRRDSTRQHVDKYWWATAAQHLGSTPPTDLMTLAGSVGR